MNPSANTTVVANRQPASSARLFLGLRARLLRNAAALLLRQSKTRIAAIALCCLIIAGTVFGGSWEGFALLRRQQLPGGGLIIGLLFDFLFLSLGGLLVFSGGLILYGSLFNSPETAFLLTSPAGADRVFAYKFQTAIGFSSWAFMLLGLPILVAFGIAYRVHVLFFAVLPAFLLGFLLIPGSVGALACFLVVNFTPRRRRQVLVLVIVLLLAAGAAWGYSVYQSARYGATDRDALQELLGRFSFARNPAMPSHWMTRGLQSAARGDWRETVYPLALVWTHGLFLYLLAAFAAAKLYRRGFNRLATGGNLRRQYGGAWLDRTATTLLGFLGPQTRLLIVKDFRTFRRDPGQWAQILIFAGLTLLYFLNARQFYQSDLGERYRHGVALTNLAATAMLLCAYLGRFVYPMLSLEGRTFWVLGLLPLSRERLVLGKFGFAAAGAVFVATPLVVVSDLLLGLPWQGLLLHLWAILLAAVGLSGLATGLGATSPNFRETDPSKIAAGFGGTLNLIVGLLYLSTVITLTAGLYHGLSIFRGTEGLTNRDWIGITSCALAGTAVAITATVVPLRAGVRALRAMEF